MLTMASTGPRRSPRRRVARRRRRSSRRRRRGGAGSAARASRRSARRATATTSQPRPRSLARSPPDARRRAGHHRATLPDVLSPGHVRRVHAAYSRTSTGRSAGAVRRTRVDGGPRAVSARRTASIGDRGSAGHEMACRASRGTPARSSPPPRSHRAPNGITHRRLLRERHRHRAHRRAHRLVRRCRPHRHPDPRTPRARHRPRPGRRRRPHHGVRGRAEPHPRDRDDGGDRRRTARPRPHRVPAHSRQLRRDDHGRGHAGTRADDQVEHHRDAPGPRAGRPDRRDGVPRRAGPRVPVRRRGRGSRGHGPAVRAGARR